MANARMVILAVVLASSWVFGNVAAVEPETDWRLDRIEMVRINLGAAGAGLGFEREIPGNSPAVATLAALINGAAPGKDHKCSNVGVVRFATTDGRTMAVGLLPSHSEGLFDLRLYEGERLVDVVTVDRDPLVAALADLGVPGDEPWMKK